MSNWLVAMVARGSSAEQSKPQSYGYTGNSKLLRDSDPGKFIAKLITLVSNILYRHFGCGYRDIDGRQRHIITRKLYL